MSVLIVGGGLAGAAAACLLGPEATLVERDSIPRHKVCGEFLSWETQAALRRLGVDPVGLRAAPIDTVRLVHGHSVVTAALPGRGLGLSRLVLDEALLGRAAGRGATILRGHSVRHLVPGGAEVTGIGRMDAARTLLATGKHDLRGAARAGPREASIGLKMLFRLAPQQAAELAGTVEVVLFPGGYAGLQPIEAGLANLCLLLDTSVYAEAGGTWAGTLAHLCRWSPHLTCRLSGAEPTLERPVAVAGIPFGFVHQAGADDRPGVFRLGDQVGVIPSFSGDGMAIALHTAFAAAASDDADGYHRQMRRDLAGQIRLAMLLHRRGRHYPRLLLATARAWPGAMGMLARLTRVAPSRLAWTGAGEAARRFERAYSAATGVAAGAEAVMGLPISR